MKRVPLLTLAVFVLLLSGCQSYDTISSTLFATILGLDHENGNYRIIYYVPSLSDYSSVNMETIKEDESKLIIGTGSSLAQAEMNLRQSVNYSLSLSKLKTIIISRTLTENTDVVGLLLYYLTDPTFVKNTYLFISDSPVTDIFLTDLDESFFYEIKTPEGVPLMQAHIPLTLVTVASHYLDSLQRIYLPYLAYDEVQKLYLKGTCFSTYDQDFSLECLTFNESKGLRWIENTARLTLAPQGYESTVKGIASDITTSYQYINNRLKVIIDVSVSLAAIYLNTDQETLKQQFRDHIYQEVTDTYRAAKDRKVDIYNLKGYVKKEFSRDYELPDNLDLTVNVTINTQAQYLK